MFSVLCEKKVGSLNKLNQTHKSLKTKLSSVQPMGITDAVKALFNLLPLLFFHIPYSIFLFEITLSPFLSYIKSLFFSLFLNHIEAKQTGNGAEESRGWCDLTGVACIDRSWNAGSCKTTIFFKPMPRFLNDRMSS